MTIAEKKPPSRTRCPRCDSTWGGLATSHCTSCHQTFSSIKGFDAHRAGSHVTGHRHCLAPTEVKYGTRHKQAGQPMFRDAGRAYPCWGLAEEDTRWVED